MRMLMRYGHDAAMRQIAVGALKLNGGVVDVMARGQHLAHFIEDGVAGRRRYVGNRDVRRERMGVTANAPDVHIVNIQDSRHFA